MQCDVLNVRVRVAHGLKIRAISNSIPDFT